MLQVYESAESQGEKPFGADWKTDVPKSILIEALAELHEVEVTSAVHVELFRQQLMLLCSQLVLGLHFLEELNEWVGLHLLCGDRLVVSKDKEGPCWEGKQSLVDSVDRVEAEELLETHPLLHVDVVLDELAGICWIRHKSCALKHEQFYQTAQHLLILVALDLLLSDGIEEDARQPEINKV